MAASYHIDQGALHIGKAVLDALWPDIEKLMAVRESARALAEESRITNANTCEASIIGFLQLVELMEPSG
ncbi:MAG TPA: hypothetical protein VJ742_12815 [Nitrososphaera sp.]|nr:hypothetical protein [Nitrososphaera sp.]